MMDGRRMAYGDRPLDNPINWSFRIGRLFGIDIRLHILFILGAVFIFQMNLPDKDFVGSWSVWSVLRDSLGIYAILFAIVLLHEFGHCFGSRAVGGEANEILLWPLGGLAFVRPPHHPRAHLVTTLAGPAVNVGLFVVLGALVVLTTGHFSALPLNPLHPMTPLDTSFYRTPLQVWLTFAFGINYLLLLFNMLLPFYPFDGGATVQAILWSRVGYHRSMEIATSVGMIGAIGIALFGLLVDKSMLMIGVGVFGYLTCWRQRRELREAGGSDMGEFGYDFSRGYASLDRAHVRSERRAGWFARYRAKRAAERADRERQREADHAAEVERLLAKVFESGLHSLTPKERRILEEETARKRAEP
jgi:Zn-dependent protease